MVFVVCPLMNISINAEENLTLDERLKLPVNEYMQLPSEFTDFKSRKLYYEENKKDPQTAAELSLFIPGAGHIYAKKWYRAIPMILFQALAIRQLYVSRKTIYAPHPDHATYANNPDQNQHKGEYVSYGKTISKKDLILNLALLGIAKYVEIMDAYHQTQKYNSKLESRLSLKMDIQDTSHIKAGLSYSF